MTATSVSREEPAVSPDRSGDVRLLTKTEPGRRNRRTIDSVFIAAGIVAFIHPGDTFVALAGVFSFILVFAGTFDIILSLSARHEIEVWWLQLIGGIIELALGLWAAGYYGRSAVLLIAWVSAFALIRGVRDIVLAFRVREVQHVAAT